MIATNHTLTGALIALTVKQPVAALALAFASHFIMDVLPHYGLPGNVTQNRKLKSYRVVMNIDTAVAALSLVALPFLLRSSVNPLLCFGCMFVSVVPDLVWLLRFFIYKLTGKLPQIDKFSLVHKKIQWGEIPTGLPIDLVWLTTVVLLINAIA